jgi:hypothetical protein
VLSDILTGNTSTLEESDLSGFAISPRRIEFTFGESLGHAKSASSETVSYKKLAKIIRPDGPL